MERQTLLMMFPLLIIAGNTSPHRWLRLALYGAAATFLFVELLGEIVGYWPPVTP